MNVMMYFLPRIPAIVAQHCGGGREARGMRLHGWVLWTPFVTSVDIPFKSPGEIARRVSVFKVGIV